MLYEEKRADRIHALRELADWLEATPEAKLETFGPMIVSYWGATKDEIVSLAKAGAPFKKQYTGGGFELQKDFGDGLALYYMRASRDEVCTKRVVGTKIVEKPDPVLAKQVPIIEVEEDVIEWDCHPLLTPDTTS